MMFTVMKNKFQDSASGFSVNREMDVNLCHRGKRETVMSDMQ